MAAISQSPKTVFTKPDLSSRVGSMRIRLAFKRWGRLILVGPQSRSGLVRSLTLLSALLPLPLSSRPRLPVDFDQVYEAWNCEPRPKRLTSWACSEW